jgi:uncharacterized protein (TIGR02646 family)
MVTLIKRHTPYPSYSDYRRYRSHLRQDFSYGCAYCTIHENEWGGLRHFHIDHFRPKSRFPQLITDYENLVYACDVCSCYKGDDWPSDDPLRDGVGYLDPCQHDYDKHFENDPTTGYTNGLTPPARYMVERLHINRQFLIRLRRKRAREEAIHYRFQQVCREALAMIEYSVQDSSLPDHARESLELARTAIETLWRERLRWWRKRWEPPYEPSDLR